MGRLAQLVEHLVYTERVIGSSPLPPTIKFNNCGGVAQLVRAPACHAGGRRFEPGHSRHILSKIAIYYQQKCYLRYLYSFNLNVISKLN